MTASWPSHISVIPVRKENLRRQLGLASATAAVAGESIAVGIFLTPAGMAKSLGSPFWLLLVWITLGVLALCGALCYGELAARFPRDGGIYVYLLEACGKRIAFLYGWMCLLVLDPGLTAALAVGLASYVASIFPSSMLAIKFIAIAVIWALCVLNILSIRVSAGFLRWTTWLKLGVLGSLVLWAFVMRLGSWSNFVPFIAQHPGSLPLGPALGAAMVGAFFSFGGWWDVSKIAGEVRDPGRTLPRAMLLGVLVVTAIYILVSAAFLYIVPLTKVTSDETFVAQAGAILCGPGWRSRICGHRCGLRAQQFGRAYHVRSRGLLRDGARWPVPARGCSHTSAIRHPGKRYLYSRTRRIRADLDRKLSTNHLVFHLRRGCVLDPDRSSFEYCAIM